eukprot:comp19978_c0_seq2/m.38996 comp19978_c0_seq2/g.38996  ORF comp19978_c0_seq2/g.38996 comp19978_c0_seq2/m.38996 type:complete len:169 (-) comp19978_c0_seq2:36-542(-)
MLCFRYTEKCKQLLSTFKTASQVSSPPLDLPAFCAKYRLECPAAIHRIKMGVPATIEHGGDDSLAGKQSDAHVAMLATEAFITVLDSLKLDLTAADDLFPILSALLDKLNGVRSLGVDFVGKEKVREWLGKINGMRASDRLSEGDTRQLLFDIESSYLAFQNVLAKKS